MTTFDNKSIRTYTVYEIAKCLRKQNINEKFIIYLINSGLTGKIIIDNDIDDLSNKFLTIFPFTMKFQVISFFRELQTRAAYIDCQFKERHIIRKKNRGGESWSDIEENNLLHEYFHLKQSYAQIAVSHRRSVSAIRTKVWKLKKKYDF